MLNHNHLLEKIWGRYKLASLGLTDFSAFQVIRRVLKNGWTYLPAVALSELHTAITAIEHNKLPGILIETGCALGGSAIVIAQAKNASREFWIYDAFGMIPPPSEQDDQAAHRRYAEIAGGQSQGIKGGKYYGYEDDLLAKVKANFAACGLEPQANAIHLVKGFYEETLAINQPVAFAHIDCDWHDSVIVCLQQIEPHLVRGGVLVIDDYQDWSGCKSAVDRYFAKRKDEFDFNLKSRLHIMRK